MLWKAFKPKDGKLSNPQLSLMPLKNHLKAEKKKLKVKYLPKHFTCLLQRTDKSTINIWYLRPQKTNQKRTHKKMIRTVSIRFKTENGVRKRT